MVAITAISDVANDSGKSVGPHIFFRPLSGWTDSKSFTTNTAETYTVPDNAKYIVLSSTVDFYANANGTAVAPGDLADGTASELNPVGFIVEGGESLSLVPAAAEACIITISVYKKEN